MKQFKDNAKTRLLALLKELRDQDYDLEGSKDEGYKIVGSRRKIKTIVMEDRIDYFIEELQKYIISNVDAKMIKLAQEHRDALEQLKQDKKRIMRLEDEVSNLKEILSQALKLIKSI